MRYHRFRSWGLGAMGLGGLLTTVLAVPTGSQLAPWLGLLLLVLMVWAGYDLYVQRTRHSQQPAVVVPPPQDDVRFRAIAELYPAFLGILGPDQQYIYANPFVWQQTGGLFGPDFLIGKYPRDVLPQHDLTAFTHCFQQVLATRQPQLLHMAGVEVEGKRHTADIHLIPILNEAGEVAEVILLNVDKSDLAAASQEIQTREALFRDVLESTSDAFYALDTEWRYQYVNANWERMFGLSASEVLGRDVRDMHPEDDNAFWQGLRQTMVSRRPHRVRDHFAPADRYLQADFTPNQRGGLSCFIRDVTAEVQQEQALAQQQELLETMASQMPKSAIFILDRDLRVQFTSGATYRELGLSPSQFIGKTQYELLPLEQAHLHIPHFLAVFATGQPRQYRAPFFHFTYQYSLTPLRNAFGDVDRLLAAAWDITDDLKHQEELAQREAELREAQRITRLGDWYVNMRNDQVRWSDELFRIHGLDPTAGPPALDQLRALYPDFAAVEANSMRAAATGQPAQFDTQIRTPAGELREVQIIARAAYDDTGGVTAIYGTTLDITDRKAQELVLAQQTERLRDQQLLLSEIMQRLPETGVAVVNQDLVIEYIEGGQLRRFSGLDPEEMIGKPLRNYRTEAQFAEHRPHYEAALQGIATEFETEYQGRTIHFSYIPLPDTRGQVRRFLSVTRDITDERQFTRRLEEVNRLFRAVGANYPNGSISIVDRDLRFVFIDGTTPRARNLPVEDLVGQPVWVLMSDPDDFESIFRTPYERAFGGEIVAFDYAIGGRHLQVQISPLRELTGQVDLVLVVTQDVTSQKQLLQRLEAQDSLFRAIGQNYPNGSLVVIDSDYIIQFHDGLEARNWGHGPQDVGRPAWELTPSREVFDHVYRPHYEQAFAGHHVSFDLELNERVYKLQVAPLQMEQGRVQRILVTSLNITDLRRAEEVMAASLREKDFLLAEIHHRVKNNLAIIAGLLLLQSNATSNQDLKRALQDCRSRIQAMALVHEKLYRSERFDLINLDEYLRELVDGLHQAYLNAACNTVIHYELDRARLSIENCIPFGLLVTEIVTNSLKHAFVGRSHGTVYVRLMHQGNRLALTIGDDGMGLPPHLEQGTSQSLGLKLIHGLCRQIGAQLSIHGGREGTEFLIQLSDEGVAGAA